MAPIRRGHFFDGTNDGTNETLGRFSHLGESRAEPCNSRAGPLYGRNAARLNEIIPLLSLQTRLIARS
jgi:hypothetical protein